MLYLSDWGQSDVGIDLGKSILINYYLIVPNQILELIWENQFKCCTLSDSGQSDIRIDLGKSIQVGYCI